MIFFTSIIYYKFLSSVKFYNFYYFLHFFCILNFLDDNDEDEICADLHTDGAVEAGKIYIITNFLCSG